MLGLSNHSSMKLFKIATSKRGRSLKMIEGAIKPYNNDIVELSMKAPMSVSKPVDLGLGGPELCV